MIIAPDTIVIDEGGISISRLVTFSRSVKTINETAKLAAINNGLRLSATFPDTEPPIITGSSGRIQGANIVTIPAINAPMNSNIG